MPIHPYEMTADPSEIGSDLPRGGGRIQMPGGDIRTFQFEPPTLENQGIALRAEAERQTQFDIQKRIADQAREDEQYLRDLQINALADEQQKVIEAAKKSIQIRKFQREFEAAKASGMTDEKAALQAAMNNVEAVGGASGVAQIANTFRGPISPVISQLPSGRSMITNPRSGVSILEQNELVDPASRPPTPMARLAYFRKQEDALNDLLTNPVARMTPEERSAKQTERDQYRKAAEALEQELGMVVTPRRSIAPPPTINPATTTAPAAGRSLPDIMVGQIYKGYRYNGRYGRGDRRSWDKIQ